MKVPTEKQIKRFWEWCGFNFAGDEGYVGFPNGTLHPIGDTPPVDLNNLFKYAVPKLMKTNQWVGMISTQMSKGTQYTFVVYKSGDIIGDSDNTDPALALFWAIWKVIKGDSPSD